MKNISEWNPSKEHFQFITSVDFTHDPITNVDYYLRVDGDTLFCIFQPTNGSLDWADDFDYFPAKFDIYPGSKIKVHEGLGRQYLGMRSQFLDMAYRNEVRNIFIAGYSLGGGLAQLSCEDAAYHFSNKTIISISYEGPRVFCPNKGVQNLLKSRQVLVKTFWDPVVHVPFKAMPILPLKITVDPFRIQYLKGKKLGISFFRDYGKPFWIGKFYRIIPLQHYVEEIEKNLFEKVGM